MSDSLASNVNTQSYESDYVIQIRDLDGSGINSYASSAFNYQSPVANAANYVLLNDGSGRLYPAVLDQFTPWVSQVLAYLQRAVPSAGFGSCPKFVLYRTLNGKYNFLAIVLGGFKKNGFNTTLYAAVNVPLQIDFDAMFTAPITVQNRNSSHLIRTFAGDDTIYSGNNGGHSHIDGGLGTNTVVYSGPARNYSATKNADGSLTIKDIIGTDGTDTLVRIQRLQFTDSVIRLDSVSGFPNAPVITDVVNGASFQPGIVPGSWVTIRGHNLSGASRLWSAADFLNGLTLPTNLSGVQVTFNGKPAAIYYVSPTQLNVQAPADLGATATVQVQYFGSSNSASMAVAPSAPGLFTYLAGSTVYPGIEPSPAGVALDAPGAVQSSIQVTVGSQNATVLGAALVYPGEVQVNITVPDLADGSYPLKMSAGGASSQAGVILPIGK